MRTLLYFLRLCYYATAAGMRRNAPDFPARVRNTLHKLGPSYVKLGQTLSVRPDIVGEEMAAALGELRDRVPPFPAKTARSIIENELGRPCGEMFSAFSEEAVAAASIAQVHKATAHDGIAVAVKIVRPGVGKAFARDIAFFYKMARLMQMRKRIRRLRPLDVVKTLEDSVRQELDMRLEAAAASELKHNTRNDSGIYVPRIYKRYCSEHVLVMEWVDGIPVNDIARLEAAGFDRADLASKLAVTFFNQAYRDGFFHADIHPGNIFVNKNGDIAPVDFGIMGRLDNKTRIFVAEILRGFVAGDYMHVARIHLAAGYVPPDTNVGDFALACRAIGEPILGKSADEISVGKLLNLLFRVTEQFNMETQPQLLLFQKTLVLVEGVGHALYPQVNLWQLAEPWITKWARDNLSVKGRVKRLKEEVADLSYTVPKNIAYLAQLIDEASHKGIRLHPDTVKRYAAARRSALLLAALTAGAAAGAAHYLMGMWLG